ncbi:hypothetical protein BC831DRAFT_454478 [Entophlyctis helioformis]|nr:hypothetical protein BC831DRAFT_454478 [Entophlyctis helioformis]
MSDSLRFDGRVVLITGAGGGALGVSLCLVSLSLSVVSLSLSASVCLCLTPLSLLLMCTCLCPRWPLSLLSLCRPRQGLLALLCVAWRFRRRQ